MSMGRCAKKVEEMEAEWRRLLTTLVTDGVKHRHFRADLDVDQFVWELGGMYLSHHVANRFLRSPDADRRAQTACSALIDRARKPSTSKTTNQNSASHCDPPSTSCL